MKIYIYEVLLALDTCPQGLKCDQIIVYTRLYAEKLQDVGDLLIFQFPKFSLVHVLGITFQMVPKNYFQHEERMDTLILYYTVNNCNLQLMHTMYSLRQRNGQWQVIENIKLDYETIKMAQIQYRKMCEQKIEHDKIKKMVAELYAK